MGDPSGQPPAAWAAGPPAADADIPPAPAVAAPRPQLSAAPSHEVFAGTLFTGAPEAKGRSLSGISAATGFSPVPSPAGSRKPSAAGSIGPRLSVAAVGGAKKMSLSANSGRPGRRPSRRQPYRPPGGPEWRWVGDWRAEGDDSADSGDVGQPLLQPSGALTGADTAAGAPPLPQKLERRPPAWAPAPAPPPRIQQEPASPPSASAVPPEEQPLSDDGARSGTVPGESPCSPLSPGAAQGDAASGSAPWHTADEGPPPPPPLPKQPTEIPLPPKQLTDGPPRMRPTCPDELAALGELQAEDREGWEWPQASGLRPPRGSPLGAAGPAPAAAAAQSVSPLAQQRPGRGGQGPRRAGRDAAAAAAHSRRGQQPAPRQQQQQRQPPAPRGSPAHSAQHTAATSPSPVSASEPHAGAESLVSSPQYSEVRPETQVPPPAPSPLSALPRAALERQREWASSERFESGEFDDWFPPPPPPTCSPQARPQASIAVPTPQEEKPPSPGAASAAAATAASADAFTADALRRAAEALVAAVGQPTVSRPPSQADARFRRNAVRSVQKLLRTPQPWAQLLLDPSGLGARVAAELYRTGRIEARVEPTGDCTPRGTASPATAQPRLRLLRGPPDRRSRGSHPVAAVAGAAALRSRRARLDFIGEVCARELVSMASECSDWPGGSGLVDRAEVQRLAVLTGGSSASRDADGSPALRSPAGGATDSDYDRRWKHKLCTAGTKHAARAHRHCPALTHPRVVAQARRWRLFITRRAAPVPVPGLGRGGSQAVRARGFELVVTRQLYRDIMGHVYGAMMPSPGNLLGLSLADDDWDEDYAAEGADHKGAGWLSSDAFCRSAARLAEALNPEGSHPEVLHDCLSTLHNRLAEILVPIATGPASGAERVRPSASAAAASAEAAGEAAAGLPPTAAAPAMQPPALPALHHAAGSPQRGSSSPQQQPPGGRSAPPIDSSVLVLSPGRPDAQSPGRDRRSRQHTRFRDSPPSDSPGSEIAKQRRLRSAGGPAVPAAVSASVGRMAEIRQRRGDCARRRWVVFRDMVRRREAMRIRATAARYERSAGVIRYSEGSSDGDREEEERHRRRRRQERRRQQAAAEAASAAGSSPRAPAAPSCPTPMSTSARAGATAPVQPSLAASPAVIFSPSPRDTASTAAGSNPPGRGAPSSSPGWSSGAPQSRTPHSWQAVPSSAHAQLRLCVTRPSAVVRVPAATLSGALSASSESVLGERPSSASTGAPKAFHAADHVVRPSSAPAAGAKPAPVAALSTEQPGEGVEQPAVLLVRPQSAPATAGSPPAERLSVPRTNRSRSSSPRGPRSPLSGSARSRGPGARAAAQQLQLLAEGDWYGRLPVVDAGAGEAPAQHPLSVSIVSISRPDDSDSSALQRHESPWKYHAPSVRYYSTKAGDIGSIHVRPASAAPLSHRPTLSPLSTASAPPAWHTPSPSPAQAPGGRAVEAVVAARLQKARSKAASPTAAAIAAAAAAALAAEEEKEDTPRTQWLQQQQQLRQRPRLRQRHGRWAPTPGSVAEDQFSLTRKLRELAAGRRADAAQSAPPRPGSRSQPGLQLHATVLLDIGAGATAGTVKRKYTAAPADARRVLCATATGQPSHARVQGVAAVERAIDSAKQRGVQCVRELDKPVLPTRHLRHKAAEVGQKYHLTLRSPDCSSAIPVCP
eukprot:TRINITY_DN8495_c0_g2_i1.p1 TRINITY_DN8495_c0_g2~~TRINITY_DN8495_c0_g2_i1.p1  ORF type:complete len:1697 (+),score=215.50 TRINITY_DN8495_c0_g2_i1:71-5092(+)